MAPSTPTPTPTPMPTWTVVPDLLLYEDFNTLGLKSDLWKVWTDRPGEFFYSQERSVLYIESKAPSKNGGLEFQPKYFNNLRISQIQNFEAKLRLVGVEDGFGLAKIGVSADLRDGWFTQCYIGASPHMDQPYFSCDVWSGGSQEYRTDRIQINRGLFYKARIEINLEMEPFSFILMMRLSTPICPKTQRVYYLLDLIRLSECGYMREPN